MKASLRVFSFSVLATTAAIAVAAQAPTPNQPPAQQPGAASSSVWSAPPTVGAVSTTPSACGNQPLCYDTPDFAVAVVDFRMSLTNGMKVMDATLRFLNKTNQPLILGYLDGSGMALDDQGNRYGTYYNKGLAGIGLVVGNSMDPKFTLQPGGAGDARFELYWRPGAQDPIGSTFEFDATIREINTLVGGQHTLGGEFPLRFQGLMNGTNGAAPSGVAATGASGAPAAAGTNPMLATSGGAALPVCGSTGSGSGAINAVAGAANSIGGQQATNATSAASAKASSAVAQLSSLRSLFSKKNTTASATTAGAPCVPAPAATATAPAATTSAPTAAPARVVNTSATAASSKAPATAATATTQVSPTSPAAMKAGAPITTRKPATPPASTGSTAPPNAINAPKPAAIANTATNTKTAPKPATNATQKKPATTTTNQTPAQQNAQQPK